MHSPLLRGLALVLCLLTVTGSSCAEPAGPDCTPQVQDYVNSFNTFLLNGAPVAVFTLAQDYATYPVECTQQDGGPITLTLTSSAPVPLRFDYTVRGLGATGLIMWSYSGTVARLGPGEARNVGLVATTPVRVDIAAEALLFNVVQVP